MYVCSWHTLSGQIDSVVFGVFLRPDLEVYRTLYLDSKCFRGRLRAQFFFSSTKSQCTSLCPSVYILISGPRLESFLQFAALTLELRKG